MKGLNYQIIECNIRILNVRIEKIRIMGEKLLLSKPPIFFPNKRKEWEAQLEELFEMEMKVQDELLKEYQELEKLLDKNTKKD